MNGVIVGRITYDTPLFLVEKKVTLKDHTDFSCSLKLKS